MKYGMMTPLWEREFLQVELPFIGTCLCTFSMSATHIQTVWHRATNFGTITYHGEGNFGTVSEPAHISASAHKHNGEKYRIHWISTSFLESWIPAVHWPIRTLAINNDLPTRQSNPQRFHRSP